MGGELHRTDATEILKPFRRFYGVHPKSGWSTPAAQKDLFLSFLMV
jgi:hypothetical protein